MIYQIGDRVKCIDAGKGEIINGNIIYEVSRVSEETGFIQVRIDNRRFWYLSRRFVLINNNLPEELFTL